jgi:sugar lactone lactonase YvrE
MKKSLRYLLQIAFYISINTSFAQTIYTYAGTGNLGNTGDGGLAISAEFAASTGIAIDASNNMYFCDWYFGRIRKIDASGIITTIAGGGTDLSNGVLATTALVRHPWGITIDALGNIYFAERQYNQVRKIDASGVITTIAGVANMTGGFAGDGGLATAASLNAPGDVAIDNQGNFYITDALNHRVRMVNSSGIISTIAGSSAGFSGDGGLAINSKLYNPTGICVDTNKNIYISDMLNHRIRKIDSLGVINTIAGTGVFANSGDGGLATSAEIGQPYGILSDGNGNIIFADISYGTIRKVDITGIITKIAGIGTGAGYSGDGGPAVLAQIQPIEVALDNAGNFYISDDTRIRIVCNSWCITNVTELNEIIQLAIYPNPVSASYINIFTVIEPDFFYLYDVLGKWYDVKADKTENGYQLELPVNLQSGIYFLNVRKGEKVITKKVMVQ